MSISQDTSSAFYATYKAILPTSGIKSDFEAMLAWLEHMAISLPVESEHNQVVFAYLVSRWLHYRENCIVDPSIDYDWEDVFARINRFCDAEDIYEVRDALSESDEHSLLALARMFDGTDTSPKSVMVEWKPVDVQLLRPELNAEQCMIVLQVASSQMDRPLCLNTIKKHADVLYPQAV